MTVDNTVPASSSATFPRSASTVPNVVGACQGRTARMPRPRIGLSPRAARRHLAQFEPGAAGC